MGKGNGSDLYYFECVEKGEAIRKLSFKSFQDCGVPKEHGFWASQFAQTDARAYDLSFSGRYRYIPICELSKYYARKLPSVDIEVTNVKESASDEVMTLLRSFGQTGVYGKMGKALTIGYRSPISANAAVIAVDGSRREMSADGTGLRVNTKVMPPSVYDYSDLELSLGVIMDVQITDVKEHENGESSATVVVKFVTEKLCEHVDVGKKWAGR